MNRRGFLAALGAGLGAFGLGDTGGVPGILRAFAEGVACAPGAGVARVADGLKAAALEGKPLLVLIVPEEQNAAAWEVGRLWGQAFYFGDDALLSLLGRCHLVAARHAEVTSVVPAAARTVRKRGPAPVALLVESDRLPAAVVPVAAPATSAGTNVFPDPTGKTWGDADRALEADSDRRLGELRAALHAAIAPDAATVRRRAAQTAAAVSEARVAAALETARTGRTDEPPAGLDDVFAAAAIVGALEGDAAAPAAKVLAAATRARLTEADVPGAYRAQASGCGSTLLAPPAELEPPGMAMACGMGHVGPRARYFLDFYVQERVDARRRGRENNPDLAPDAP